MITGIKTGTAEVTATSNGITKTAVVSVESSVIAIESVKITNENIEDIVSLASKYLFKKNQRNRLLFY